MRPAPLDPHNVRAWVAPNGLVLCTDPQFASLTGLTSEEMVRGWLGWLAVGARCRSGSGSEEQSGPGGGREGPGGGWGLGEWMDDAKES